jgi:hypothetical protein
MFSMICKLETPVQIRNFIYATKRGIYNRMQPSAKKSLPIKHVYWFSAKVLQI